MSVASRLGALIVLAPLLLAFDLDRHSVPSEDILSGGPQKDGIPALLHPTFVTPVEAELFLKPDDRIVGLSLGDAAKAYPLHVLNWHEVVNDTLDQRPVLITYCPLTGSAVVFDRTIDAVPRTFGVSGRLYQSNVLLYDHETESLWSQLGGSAIAGPRTGSVLRAMPAIVTTWEAWRQAHPSTLVLSTKTGYARDYAEDPYAEYATGPGIAFPVSRHDDRLPMKARVFGVADGGDAAAYPRSALSAQRIVQDRLAGRPITIELDRKTGAVRARTTGSREELSGVEVFWFAWAAFHPDSRIWHRSSTDGEPARATEHPPEPTGIATGSESITIVDHAAYWTDVPAGPLGSDSDSSDLPALLVIRGTLRNVAAHQRAWVHLRYELVDSGGEVVASEEGYNLTGETLRPVEGLADAPAAPPPPPLAAGHVDGFRMFFLRTEVPAFDRYRVRVLDAPMVSARSAR